MPSAAPWSKIAYIAGNKVRCMHPHQLPCTSRSDTKELTLIQSTCLLAFYMHSWLFHNVPMHAPLSYCLSFLYSFLLSVEKVTFADGWSSEYQYKVRNFALAFLLFKWLVFHKSYSGTNAGHHGSKSCVPWALADKCRGDERACIGQVMRASK
jgi:hypothetical protein